MLSKITLAFSLLLSISTIGYTTKYVDVNLNEKKTKMVDLGRLSLSDDANQLSELVVTSNASKVQVSGDSRGMINRFNETTKVSLVGNLRNTPNRWGWNNGLRNDKRVGLNLTDTREKLQTEGSVMYRYNGSDVINESSSENFTAQRGSREPRDNRDNREPRQPRETRQHRKKTGMVQS